ncbi:MAG: GNAT family N-acetyltransferase [Chloroflexota bacterium]
MMHQDQDITAIFGRIEQRIADKPDLVNTDAIVEIRLTGDSDTVWTIDLTTNPTSITPQTTGKAQCTITLTTEDFVSIVQGKMHPMQAEHELDGDPSKLQFLGDVLADPLSSDAAVTLREITKDNLGAVLGLEVANDQKNFVAPNSVSIAQAHYSDVAWFRAIYAGETPVGFIMLSDDDEKKRYYLWRLMVDRRQQGKGFGYQAVNQLIDYVRTRPEATELLVSYVPGQGSPKPFYKKLGFVETGEVHHGEHEMRLILA